jgi:general secretion pathway protein G
MESIGTSTGFAALGRGRSVRRMPRRRVAGGFTLVEMMFVVAIIGIVATIALPQYRHATQKAREAVLKEDLWTMNDVIDQYKTDHGEYPASLETLVDSSYLKIIPVDPITRSRDTWVTETEEPPPDAPEEEQTVGGITVVHSGAPGVGLDGTEYTTW